MPWIKNLLSPPPRNFNNQISQPPECSEETYSPTWFRCFCLCAAIKELDLAVFGFPVLLLTALFNGQTVCFIYLTGFLHIV